jgi:hypothetical protein
VREVDQQQDAVDQRVAERDERVDGAVGQPDKEDLGEQGRRLDQVDDEPEDDEPDEREPDQRRDARPRPAADCA